MPAMQAMLLHQPKPVDQRPLVATEVANPSPGPAEVLVRVRVCGVCRTDLHVVEGELRPRRLPVIPGHEAVGVVAARGAEARRFEIGDRVGIAWLHDTCGTCQFCRPKGERENLCTTARFTGWSVDGGFAEFAAVPEAYAYRVPEAIADEQAAPLLCAGIIGYRVLRLSGIERGQRLGLYGFGASAHIAIQIVRHLGCEVYVFTRSEANRELARRLGATWIGGSRDTPPAKMNSSIVFAPAGPLIPDALKMLEKGGTVALAGIFMSEIPPMDYTTHLYDEKVLRSVANATRSDGEELLAVAAEIPIRTETTLFPLDRANEALLALKTGGISGAAVLQCHAQD